MADSRQLGTMSIASAHHETFQDFIRAYLRQSGLTASELAKDAAISKTYIYEVLNPGGTTQPSQTIARKLATTISALSRESRDSVLNQYGYVVPATLHPSNYPENDIGRWVADLRKFTEMNQHDFGAGVNMTRKGITDNETGATPPSSPDHFSLGTLLERFYPVGISDQDLLRYAGLGPTMGAARRRLHLTMQYTADQVEVNVSNLYAFESGAREPSIKHARRLAQLLGPAFPVEFTADDALEMYGYPTKRAIHPKNFPRRQPRLWLTTVRNFHDLGQEEFAEELGVKRSTLSAYETGRLSLPFALAEQAYETFIEPIMSHDQAEYFSLNYLRIKFDPESAGRAFFSILDRGAARRFIRRLEEMRPAMESGPAPDVPFHDELTLTQTEKRALSYANQVRSVLRDELGREPNHLEVAARFTEAYRAATSDEPQPRRPAGPKGTARGAGLPGHPGATGSFPGRGRHPKLQ